jgi:hypothetical protein
VRNYIFAEIFSSRDALQLDKSPKNRFLEAQKWHILRVKRCRAFPDKGTENFKTQSTAVKIFARAPFARKLTAMIGRLICEIFGSLDALQLDKSQKNWSFDTKKWYTSNFKTRSTATRIFAIALVARIVTAMLGRIFCEIFIFFEED